MHNHHIIPRHEGGTDDPSNLIKVTVKEHAQIHYNRWKIYEKYADYIAWKALSGRINKEELIIERCRLGGMTNKGKSKKPTAKNWLRKEERTEAQRNGSKLGGSKRTGENNPFYNKIHTQKSLNKMIETRNNHPTWRENTSKIAVALGAASKGKPKPKRKVQCGSCERMINSSNIKRHFDNCKVKGGGLC